MLVLQKNIIKNSESNILEEDKTNNKRSRAKSNLVYSKYLILYKYRNIIKFSKRSSDSKRNDVIGFKDK